MPGKIDGGLRDILSSDEAKKNIQKQLTTKVLAKFGDPNELKERRGHIASILAALGIEDVGTFLPDDVRVNFATRWINVSPQFPKFVPSPWGMEVPSRQGRSREFLVRIREYIGSFSRKSS